MIPVAQTKRDLGYSLDLAGVIDVLKMIASSQFRSLSSRREEKDVIKDKIVTCFELLTSISKTNPFLVERKDAPKSYLMVCSDEGFLGEVNSIIVETALRRGLKENTKFIMLGERGARVLRDSQVDFIAFPGVKNDVGTEHIAEIANYVLKLYKKKQISSLHVVYMKFETFTRRHLDIVKLLPCNEIADFIKGKGSKEPDTLIEPSPYFVIEYLVKMWLEDNLYNIFWSSKLSEWSVRVMHLEHSTDELKEINRNLKFRYFKAVHALNDKVIREIFAARTKL